MKNITLIVLLVASAIITGCTLLNRTSVLDSNKQNFTSNSNTNTANVKSDYEIQQERESKRTSWISDKTSELSKIPKSSKITKQPYIKNLAVAFYKGEFEETFTSTDSYIPTGAKAFTDEEAQTVILVKEKSEYYADYRVTGRRELVPAFIIYNEVIIIDRSIPAVIYRKTFAGKQPGKNITVSEYDTVINGEAPDDKVMEFLNNLPRK
ncbi:hypothetical protein BH10ACI1_BH10ACI1_21150 [soil metagenome]